MAKLDSLELIGFKSFSDKTQLRFNSEVTAIVGPNGCGKSNIADAINWVVGEQSVKSLRADKMEDVIFNGTARRKAMGMAEVTLRLRDLEQTKVNKDGEEETVFTETAAITRRVYRNGEGEYFINDKHCRLKDIYDLLEGTGLGHSSYALIEQGRIDRILSAKPQERRALIEDAAKVAVFKNRKKAALIKLEAAQQNLSRVNDLLVELERQLKSLQRQAAGARRYARLREEYRQMVQCRILLESTQIQERLQQIHQQHGEQEKEDRQVRQLVGELGEERDGLTQNLEAREEQLRDARDQLARMEQQRQRTEQQIHYQTRQAQESGQRVSQLRRQSESSEAKAVEQTVLRENLIQGRSHKQSRLEDRRREESRLKTEIESLQRDSEKLQVQIQQVRQAAMSHTDHITHLRNGLVDCQKLRSISEGKLERLHQEGIRLTEQKAITHGNLAAQRHKLQDIQSRWEGLREQSFRLEEEISHNQQKLAEAEQEVAGISDRFSQLRHRLSSLEEIEQRRAHYSEGTQKFLSSAPSGHIHYSGLLADMVDSKAEYEYVVEQHLNEQLQYVVVNTIDDGVQAVGHARQIKAGKCTFLSLHGANGQAKQGLQGNGNGHLSERGAVGWLREQLEMKPELETALRRILPDFFSTLLVRDLDAAKDISGDHTDYSFLTLDGDFLSPRGLLSSVGEKQGSMGPLSLRRQKRDVEKQIDTVGKQLEDASQDLAEKRDQSTQLRERLRNTQQESHQAELERARLEHMVETLEKDRQRIEQAEQAGKTEKEHLLSEQAEQAERIAVLEGEIAHLEGSSQSSAENLSELQSRLSALQEKKEEASSQMADIRTEIAQLLEQVGNTERELQRLQREEEDLRQQAQRFLAEADKVETAASALLASNEELTAMSVRLQEEKAVLEEDLEARELVQRQQKARWTEVEKEIQELQARHEEIRDRLAQSGTDLARSETELESLRRFCLDEFQSPLESVVETADLTDMPTALEEVQMQCTELRQKIDKFGPVNMRALEEFKEIEDRKNFQDVQRKDIEESIVTTRKTIEEIDLYSTQQFKEAFDQINRNFTGVYQILFNGGHAEMRLLDEGDPSESGIEIIASPPGKRLQSMMLLSGGEKALTALALLMGIFQFRPAPFCLLDEVDAPLDEANVQRFAAMLTQMSSTTQFVMITHNKRTIEAAQFLYGVTMREPGISSIASVRFN